MRKKQVQQDQLSYSVFDRLCGPEYDSTMTKLDGEPNLEYVNRMTACVARDLQNLLNTRKMELNLPELPALRPSIVDYGVMDLSSITAGSKDDQEKFRDSVLKAIENYEPRLKKVEVSIIEEGPETRLIFHFKISAVLMIDPVPLKINFDSILPTDIRMFKVRGQGLST